MKYFIHYILLVIVIAIALIAGFGIWWQFAKKVTPNPINVTNFEECVAAGNSVMESYPRQCKHNSQTFIEDIGNELTKVDLVRITSPRPNTVITSPLIIKGEARGIWFFEASFPVFLTDWDGKIIAQGIAQAKGEWMTTDFVPFEATLTFTTDKNVYSNRGSLILKKDNPSGLPEHDDALEIPVVFAKAIDQPTACTQEAKLCPNGSYVSRTGPNCEFSPCPVAGMKCNGVGYQSCPAGFECVQSCGPPVVQYPNNNPPEYFCQPEGYVQNCPICLAKNTLIDTPLGAIAVQDLENGMPVWTVTKFGQRVAGIVMKKSMTPVPLDHQMVDLILDDGRTLLVSPGHPMIDKRTAGDFAVGDVYDGAKVISSNWVFYSEGYTYDLLPSGETGFYFANNILLDSTLR